MARQPGGGLFGLPAGTGLSRQAAKRRLQRLSRLCQEQGRGTLRLLGPRAAGVFRGPRTSAQSGGLVVKPDWTNVWLGKTTATEPGGTGLAPSPSSRPQPDGRGTI